MPDIVSDLTNKINDIKTELQATKTELLATNRVVEQLNRRLDAMEQLTREKESKGLDVRRRLVRKIDDYVVEKKLYEDGKSLLAEVEVTISRNNNGNSAASADAAVPTTRYAVDDLDMETVLEYVENYFNDQEPPSLHDLMVTHTPTVLATMKGR